MKKLGILTLLTATLSFFLILTDKNKRQTLTGSIKSWAIEQHQESGKGQDQRSILALMQKE